MDGQRLRRVFDVLEYVAKRGCVTATEVSRALDLPISSSHDLLKSMAKIEAVSEDRKSYMLGPLALRFSINIADGISVQDVARPHLEKLAECSQLDTYLAVRLGSNVVYSSRYPGTRAVNIDIPLGHPLYLHSTAAGKLFAALDRGMYQALVAAPRPRCTDRTRTTMDQLAREFHVIRSQGLAISRGESVPGILGIALPIRDHAGRLIAAAHVSMFQASVSVDYLRQVCELTNRTTRAIERDLAELAQPGLDAAPRPAGADERRVGQRHRTRTVARRGATHSHV